MTDETPADQQVLAILAQLQEAVAQGAPDLKPDEISRIRKILAHGETLVELAKYEEAKGIIRARWRSVILGIGAVVSALVLLWDNAERLGLKIWGLLQ